jgi:hydroxyacylglutathione hydrolase
LAATSEHSLQELAALLYDSIQKVKTLDAHLRILPAHGSGSSCGKAIGDGNSCTLEKQIANNYALKINSKEEFVNAVTKGIAKPPVCFSHNITLNKSGPVSYSDLLKQSTTPLSIEQFKELIAKGHPVIDTRSSAESLKEGYIKGSYLVGDSGYLSIWVGSLLDPRK